MKARWLELRKRHWDGRSASERRILTIAALVLLPLAAYFLLWQPAHSASAKLRAAVPAMRAQADLMRGQAAEAEMLRHRPHPAVLEDGALKLAVEASAARHQLREALSTLDPMESRAVRITLASVPFEKWLGWLRDLQQEQHIRAESIAISALPQAGMVKVSATLTSGRAQ